MDIAESADGTVVRYDSTRLTSLLLMATGLCLLVAGYDVFVGTRGTERLIGLLGAAATCLAVAIALLERAHFRFEPGRRIVIWRRRWALQQRSGSMPFDSIQSVLVERPIGDEGTPSRRITLRTTSGDSIPITVGYRPDGDGKVLEIASRLKQLLGHGADPTRASDVRALIAAGRTIDAIRVLREQGLTLLEAKRRVEELTRSSYRPAESD